MRSRRRHETALGEQSDSASQLLDTPFTFADVYDRHVHQIYRFVHRRCQDHSLAEDLTQETFMKAIQSTNDPNSLTIGWLMTVARNQLIDVLRRRTTYDQKLRLVGALGTIENEIDLADRLRVQNALGEMSIDYRLVLTLHYIDGFTVQALAEHLDRSPKSVEGLITRARRALKMRLDEHALPPESVDVHE